MASVYAATHVRTGSRVAAKVLHRDLEADPEARARVLAEARAANRVRHPAIARVFDADTDEDGAAYLVMELLCGDTIEHRLMGPGCVAGAREVACLLHELLDVLAAAHDRGVVHRDIKPSNVFLTCRRTLKLLDFGIAAVQGSSLVPEGALALGTPAFMAPEQVSGAGDVDPRSDLWSAAATAFTLLSGRPVHGGPTPRDTIVACASRAAPPLATVAPAVGLPLARVIDRALLFRKEDRWTSARAMQTALVAAHREMFGPRSTRVVCSMRRRGPARGRAEALRGAAVCRAPVESGSARPAAVVATPPGGEAKAVDVALAPVAVAVPPTLRSLTG
jgi:serine/threonine-protein kinase